MTVAMDAIYRRLPPELRYPLPPRSIAMQLAEAAGIKRRLTPQQRVDFTLILHFAMGGAAGIAYSLFGAARRRAPNGPLFGLWVWFANYVILLPLFRVLAPATRRPAPRNLLLIMSHLVWGLFVAKLFRAMSGDREVAVHEVRLDGADRTPEASWAPSPATDCGDA